MPRIGLTLVAAMQAFLRFDPDIIMVGDGLDTTLGKRPLCLRVARRRQAAIT